MLKLTKANIAWAMTAPGDREHKWYKDECTCDFDAWAIMAAAYKREKLLRAISEKFIEALKALTYTKGDLRGPIRKLFNEFKAELNIASGWRRQDFRAQRRFLVPRGNKKVERCRSRGF